MASEPETLESVLTELGMELPEDPIEVCIEIDFLSLTISELRLLISKSQSNYSNYNQITWVVL